jgi:hypothetical protein
MADDSSTNDDFQTNNPDDTNPMQAMKDDQKLAGDDDTPFSPPSGTQDRIDDTHQAVDTNIDPHEHYDEGIEGAAEIDLPVESADEDQDFPNKTTA